MAQEQGSNERGRLFDDVVDYVSSQYVEDVDRETLYQYAIQGILEGLGDPNTSLLDPTAYEDFRIQTEGDYGGVGLQIAEREDFITVVSPLPGTPGARAGIRAGDRITRVGEESTRGWSVEEAVQILRGPEGSDVEVTIERPGVDSPIRFTLTRQEIQLRSVPYATLLERDVGYVPLGMFSQSSTTEIREAVDSLRAEGATSIVLDLRGNPGGVLDQGVGVADLFLESGADVVETRGPNGGPNGVLRASQPDRYEGMPVAVLVDRGSASASEIVAGALQDHDRALLLGTSTFGKGSVQSLFPISGGHVLKLTTARWYTPLGRSIDRVENPLDEAGPDPLVEEEHLPITVMGQYAIPPDTAGRPTVTSAAGRTLYGGGGIVPDLLIPMDTLTTDEQAAVRRLFEEAGVYSVGVFNYAVQYLRENERIGPDFDVGEAELDALYTLLSEQEGFTADRDTFERARRFVELQLETEIAGQGWGDLEGFRRRMQYDEPLQTAIDLLRGATTPEDLFSGAGVPIPDAARAASPAGGPR